MFKFFKTAFFAFFAALEGKNVNLLKTFSHKSDVLRLEKYQNTER